MSSDGVLARLGRSDAASGLALISPTALYAILLLAAPLGTILLYSFLTDGYLEIIRQFTFANYVEAWTKRALPHGHAALALRVDDGDVGHGAAGLSGGLFRQSFHVDPSRKALWLFLITIPFWTSYLIRVFLWKVILGYNGVVNSALMALGITSEPLQWISYNVGAVVMTLAHAYAPFAILPIFVALEKIDRACLRRGRIWAKAAS